jgi:hypothetical protein
LKGLKGNTIHYTRTPTQTNQPTNMSTILKLNAFDSSNLIAASPKPMGNMGGKSISVNYKFPEGQAPITIQTSWMRSFGINKWINPSDESAPPKLSVTLSFQGVEADAKIAELKDVLSAIDEWAIDTAHKNSWEWLKTKSAPRDTIAFNYTRSFKYPVDKDSGEPNGKPATMKLKLDRDNTNGGYKAAFFNKERVSIPANDVDTVFAMGSKVRALFECTGFWVAAGKFGLSWRLKQMIIDPPSRIGKDYAFNDDEEEAAPVAVTAAPTPKKAVAPVAEIANSDNEEEEEEAAPAAPVQEEPEPEPTQAKKVVRKVVAKK